MSEREGEEGGGMEGQGEKKKKKKRGSTLNQANTHLNKISDV